MSKIFSLTEAAAIALHGTVLIAKSNKMLNVIQIAEATGSSKHHVAKVLQRLVKDDILISHRGPHGGFSLKRKPETVTLLKIYQSIEGTIDISDCQIDNHICPFDASCILGNIANQMTIKFKDYLESQTLSDVLVGIKLAHCKDI